MNRYGTFKIVLALFIGAFFLSGCAAVAGKVAGVLVKPVAIFAKADATTTNKWIDREFAAGRLTEAEVSIARQCPDAVLAMAKLRAQVEGDGEDDIEGTKGLIFLGVRALFAKSIKDQAVLHAKDIVANCSKLVPVEKLFRFF